MKPLLLQEITRPSCLECVEKHLGAAWVPLSKHRHGCPYRLRAVGHLFKADDESQEWPQIHDALREARKAYQADGVMPDWAVLEQLTDHVRLAE